MFNRLMYWWDVDCPHWFAMIMLGGLFVGVLALIVIWSFFTGCQMVTGYGPNGPVFVPFCR